MRRFVSHSVIAAAFGLLVVIPDHLIHAQSISPDSLRRVGREVLRAHVQKYGVESSPEMRRDVEQILGRLRTASGYDGPKIEWELVRDTTLNAAAGPGAVMIINSGLPKYCHAFTTTPLGDRSPRARYEGCLGSVIGHELAHITLGHMDSLASAIYRRQQIDQHMENVTSVADVLRDKILTGDLVIERTHELEADRFGALYLLRAGWQIQDMMDLFRSFDSVDRKMGVSRDLSELTWLRDHPRGAEREARLEAFRASLKLAQRDFDDALTLINNGVVLDSAIAMLDRVLTAFPDLDAAQHARAAALHQQWLEGTPVAQRQLQGSVITYSKWFIPTIRGGDMMLLNNARGAYRTVLSKQEHPYTLANLALLDAYAGDVTNAQKEADRAAQLKPKDPFVLNDRGVVLFLNGRKPEAARSFESAMDASADSVVDAVAPALLFNAGKTFALLKDRERAVQYLNNYLKYDLDDRSEWRREALLLIRQFEGSGPVATVPAANRPAATKRTTPAPAIAGIKLGDKQAAVVGVLGKPDDTASVEGGILWHYQSRGIVIGVDPQAGVVLVALMTPSAGEIEGVRVGSTVAAAMAKWGNPSDVGQDNTMIFDRGVWLLHAGVENGVVTMIGITPP